MSIKLSVRDQTAIRSQHQFQLHAIAESVDTVVRALRQRTGADESGYRLIYKKSQHSVSLCLKTDTHDSATTEIEFLPLFPGSYTQQEVAVRGAIRLDSMAPDNLPLIDKQRGPRKFVPLESMISPLDPALHFARFNSLPKHCNRPFTSSGRKIVILWKPDALINHDYSSVSNDHQQLLKILEKGAAESVDECQLIVICLNSDRQVVQRLHKHRNHWKQWLSEHSESNALDIHFIGLHEYSALPLMALLSKADSAIVPDISLAMDCLNAGCSFKLYGTQSTAEYAEHVYDIHLSEIEERSQIQQRARLTETQQKALAAETVIADIGELDATIVYLLESLMPCQTIALTHQNESADTASIIPVNIKQNSRVRSWLSTRRAKLRKLRQSPRQFMQDSQNPGLRLLGRLSI